MFLQMERDKHSLYTSNMLMALCYPCSRIRSHVHKVTDYLFSFKSELGNYHRRWCYKNGIHFLYFIYKNFLLKGVNILIIPFYPILSSNLFDICIYKSKNIYKKSIQVTKLLNSHRNYDITLYY